MVAVAPNAVADVQAALFVAAVVTHTAVEHTHTVAVAHTAVEQEHIAAMTYTAAVASTPALDVVVD